ncbi:MAG: site-specific DNA-methyltransferase [Sulfuricella sp.]|nr:site-specific DNA-methyltransferase [Sulfuricella sp.]
MTDDNKLPLATPNPADDLLAQLRESAPRIFSEGRIDLDKLKAALGEHIDPRIERYSLNWAGKSDAFRNVQQPSVGTLLPQPDESLDWDSTENLIIEGDNLEVLKLLQKPYHGKVKMIYIDPPYNTGNEFIYPDNYREGLDDYLRYSGQVSDEGIKQSTNTETSGRFHSKWLNMMYPRLFLARNLLRDDGVIFVSIDDNEVHNLRMLMNEVFGEENFVAQAVWQKKTGAGAHSKGFIVLHEYVLCYARHLGPDWDLVAPMSTKTRAMYNKRDEHFNRLGPYATWPLDTTSMDERANLRFPIYYQGQEIWPRKQWLWSKNRVEIAQRENKLIFNFDKKNGTWSVRFKGYLNDLDGVERLGKPTSLFVGPYTQEGTKDFSEHFERDVFPFPKPIGLIKNLLSMRVSGADTNDENAQPDIILDFFAGSGTTAPAVLELNNEDGGNRKFILVQLPEKTDNPQYPTIADITRERVRRVIAKLNQADAGQLNLAGKARPDRGFRAFKLSSSNFRIWDAAQASTETDQLALQLQHYTDNVDDARAQQDILFELILKAGLPLAAKVEQIGVESKLVFSVADGQLLICLENPITQAVLRGMMAREPQQILCLDTAFHGNDPLKTNAVLEAKSHGIAFRTV